MKATLAAAFTLATLTFTAPALAGQTCAYVIGDVEGQLVTTAAVLIAVPDSGMDVDPVLVHVDDTEQNILGYSFYVPGVDEGWDPSSLYVPGVDAAMDGFSEVLAELEGSLMFCLEGSYTTEAIPVYVPASQLVIPGALTNVPAIHFNIAGREWSLPGQKLVSEGKTIIIPAFSATIPPRHYEVPDNTIGIQANGKVTIVNHLEAAN